MKNVLMAFTSALVLSAALPAHNAMACSLVIPGSNFYLNITGVSEQQRADLKPVFTDANGNVIDLADFQGGYESVSTAAGRFTLTLSYKSDVVLTYDVDVKKGLCYTPPVTLNVTCETIAAETLSCRSN